MVVIAVDDDLEQIGIELAVAAYETRRHAVGAVRVVGWLARLFCTATTSHAIRTPSKRQLVRTYSAP
jgi:hypothetical protein